MATKTLQYRDFSKGMNQTSARTALRDDEMNWLENAQPIGPGQLQILAPPGAAIATVNAGVATLWGVTMKIGGVEVARLITVNQDGSMSSINPVSGTVTAVCGAGKVTTSARLSMWQDTPILIGDPTKGYFYWDGTTFTGPVGAPAPSAVTDVASFEGRACLLSGTRSITLSAPASYTDFNTVDGALTFPITDSVFAGSIRRILSALEVLWVIGVNAVNAVSNIQFSSPGPTTFQNTNVVSSVGTLLPSSVTSFFRTFLFLSPYGVYAVVGATPQKLSEQLDGLFPNLSFGTDQPAGVVSINRVFVWCVLVTYTDPSTNVARPVLLCFSRNAWFVAAQGNLTWIASLINLTTGNPELWGTDGSAIYKCFGSTTNAGSYTIKTKLYDLGSFTTRKQMTRIAVELANLPANINLTATATNELGFTTNIPLLAATVQLIFTGLNSAVLTFTGAGGAAIVWVLQSFQYRSYVNMAGDYIGLTLSGTSLPFTLSGIAFEIESLGEWT